LSSILRTLATVRKWLWFYAFAMDGRRIASPEGRCAGGAQINHNEPVAGSFRLFERRIASRASFTKQQSTAERICCALVESWNLDQLRRRRETTPAIAMMPMLRRV
jgi:hypothetical protein